MSEKIALDAKVLLGTAPYERTPSVASAAAEFEGHLLGAMLRMGTLKLGESHPLDGGSAGRMYRELLYEEIGRIAGERGALGISQLLETPSGARETAEET